MANSSGGDAGGRSSGGYVLGVNPAELERLGFQHQLWSAEAHELWERSGLTRGMTVLDAGAGPGFATMELAQMVGPEGRVCAVDEAGYYLDHLKMRADALHLDNVETRVGDVQRLGETGLDAASFDFAYMRWTLCFVPDPDAVIAGLARLLKPGGRLAIQDYFNYRAFSLAPRSQLLEKVIGAVEASWRMRGGDPDIVARLPALCRAHGLEVRELGAVQRVARHGDVLWHWPTTFFRNFLPELEKAGLLSSADVAAFRSEWEARSNDPDSFFVAPTVFNVSAVKR